MMTLGKKKSNTEFSPEVFREKVAFKMTLTEGCCSERISACLNKRDKRVTINTFMQRKTALHGNGEPWRTLTGGVS